LELNKDGIFMLSNSTDEVYLVVDISNSSLFSSRSTAYNPSKIQVDIDNTPYNMLYIKLAH
jgi:hypothetical protein